MLLCSAANIVLSILLSKHPQVVRHFKFIIAPSMNMTVLWDIAPCTLVKVDRRFRCAHSLQYQGDYGGYTHLWNVGILQQVYTALYSIRLSFSIYVSVSRWETTFGTHAHTHTHTRAHTHWSTHTRSKTYEMIITRVSILTLSTGNVTSV
jgi:hypothetical protein